MKMQTCEFCKSPEGSVYIPTGTEVTTWPERNWDGRILAYKLARPIALTEPHWSCEECNHYITKYINYAFWSNLPYNTIS